MDAAVAVEVLRSFRPMTRVRLPDGTVGEVMCQLHEKVLVRKDGLIATVNRWECEVVS